MSGAAGQSRLPAAGSLTDAEDAVQETYARWYAMPGQQRDAIASPGGWLTTVASRICLDLLAAARSRRERYVGESLPEPLPDPAEWSSATADPADRVTLGSSPGSPARCWHSALDPRRVRLRRAAGSQLGRDCRTAPGPYQRHRRHARLADHAHRRRRHHRRHRGSPR
jgi:DNA-directed RNA polymerase specialized sigma24 family protein